MKIVVLVIILQIAVFKTYSQKHESSNLQLNGADSASDAREFQGYLIKLKLGNAEGYGFQLLGDNKVVQHEFKNPLPFSPKGVQKKEDAYKIAQWIINQYVKTGHWENMVPPHVARLLGIQSINK